MAVHAVSNRARQTRPCLDEQTLGGRVGRTPIPNGFAREHYPLLLILLFVLPPGSIAHLVSFRRQRQVNRIAPFCASPSRVWHPSDEHVPRAAINNRVSHPRSRVWSCLRSLLPRRGRGTLTSSLATTPSATERRKMRQEEPSQEGLRTERKASTT